MTVIILTEHEMDTETSSEDRRQTSLDLLQATFPHQSREELEEMLVAFDGDVDLVIDTMSC